MSWKFDEKFFCRCFHFKKIAQVSFWSVCQNHYWSRVVIVLVRTLFDSFSLCFILCNTTNFHRETPVLESLFNKVADLNFIKKSLQHNCFPIKFAKFVRTIFFTEHLQWLLHTLIDGECESKVHKKQQCLKK